MGASMNPAIVTLFMPNINPQVVQTQAKVVEKYNKSKIKHYLMMFGKQENGTVTGRDPGGAMDVAIKMIRDQGHDAVMFLDVDAIPLCDIALDYFFERAYAGVLIGDAQRSGHIENGEHIFCAPHNVTFTFDVYDKCGQPSMRPNERGDVSEEITWKAEENNIPVEFVMPIRYDAAPIRMYWESEDSPPYWDLGKGKQKYGIGTTFANDKGELFWHMFQSFYPGQDERFLKKCEKVLGNS